MHRVFIYGTLKRGFPNHDEVMKNAKFLGNCTTIEKYPLYVVRPWFAPVVISEPGIGYRIKGELFEVDDAKLKELDKIESTHTPDGYRRHHIKIEMQNSGETLGAYVYMKERSLVEIVHSEMLDEYQDDSRYIPMNKRDISNEAWR